MNQDDRLKACHDLLITGAPQAHDVRTPARNSCAPTAGYHLECPAPRESGETPGLTRSGEVDSRANTPLGSNPWEGALLIEAESENLPDALSATARIGLSKDGGTGMWEIKSPDDTRCLRSTSFAVLLRAVAFRVATHGSRIEGDSHDGHRHPIRL